MSLISAQCISKVFGAARDPVVALADISLDIEEGEFLAIMGPSGSGKTTLLTVLGAMSAPSSGKVIIDGTSIYSLSPDGLADFRAVRLGFVFQQLHLIPYLTVIENVMLPFVISTDHGADRDCALGALRQVGLESKALRLPGQLSSGEQARAAIARAMVRQPHIILADEPTGNLDSGTGQDIMRLFQALNERGHTIIMVTHNQEAAAAARRRIYLRDGRIA
ncbi:MAG: ABC transporter ATP-binding protein [Chloroflexi bacterium]|nr:ABC transporter ATP-binding protein [Chloroflexota bacterium]